MDNDLDMDYLAAVLRDGMTLRDQFAMATLSGLSKDWEEIGTPESTAKYAYKIADAMMKERSKKENGS